VDKFLKNAKVSPHVCNNTSLKLKISFNLFTTFCFKASRPVGIPTYYSKSIAAAPQIYNDTVDTVAISEKYKIKTEPNRTIPQEGSV
jgi:hypothetical protein